MTNWFITGIGSGLGQSLARAVLARGDRVYGTTRSEASRAAFEATSPGTAIGFALDLRDADRIADVVREAERLSGGIDHVVNNAGYGIVGAVEETGLAQARAMLDVNLFAAAAVIQAALPAMRLRRRGDILNITSMSGHAPWAGTAWYGASKYALECLGQTLADEVRGLGIRVMNVAPGGMRTDFAGDSLVRAEQSIADYAESAHHANRTLSAGHGKERGDADLAAAAILSVLERPQLPATLFLGEDAHRHLTESMDRVRAELEAWMPIARASA